MKDELFDVEEMRARETYTNEARKRFEILRSFAWEFLNLKISLAPPGFVNHYISGLTHDIVNGKLRKRFKQ